MCLARSVIGGTHIAAARLGYADVIEGVIVTGRPFLGRYVAIFIIGGLDAY